MVHTSEIFKIDMGQSPSSKVCNQNRLGLPFYQGVTDFGSRHPTPTTWCTKPRKIAKKNTILFSVRAPVGEINITLLECAVGRGIAAILCNKNDLMYSYYLLAQNKKQYKYLSQGTIFESINREHIIKVTLQYTNNKQEQIKIASILSNVDAMIETTQSIIDKTEKLKKGLMQQLLTKGIGHTKFKKVKWLFGKAIAIPEDWEKYQLKCIGKLSAGGTPSTFTKTFWNNGTIPWLSSSEVKNNKIMHSDKKITKLGLKNSTAKIFPKGTVLVAITGFGMTRGRSAILGIDAATNQSIVGIQPNAKLIDSLFLWYSLQKMYWKIRNLAQGTQQPGLNLNILEKFQVYVPSSLLEQKKISAILSNVDAYIQENQESKQNLEQLKKGLMQKLLTGQIRVKG